MLNTENNTEFEELNKYNKCIIQLYRALNRQYSKENAISVVGNLIYKGFGYKSMYFDIVENNKTIIIKNLSYKYSDSSDIENNFVSGVFNLKLPINEYKSVIYLEDENSIKKIFPRLDEIVSPSVILSTPVFSRNKLIGIFIVYDTCKRKIAPEFKNLVQLATRELTAVFSRIERHNLVFENMLDLTALENILLYNLEEDQTDINNSLQKIVSILPNATGMKKCILAFIDNDKELLIPYYSNLNVDTIIERKKHFLNKSKSKDSIAITAMKTRKPVIIYDALTDPRCDNESAKKLGIYSIIILPILDIRVKPLGVLCLHNGKYETFSGRQMRFLEIITRYIGLVISNMDYIDDLKTWSKYDWLTGLLNRRAFESIYDKIYNVCKFGKEGFSILMVDIDDFKLINDIYGHQVGDKVLRGVAKCIKQNVRGKDIVARYGGEEIIIILKGIDKIGAKTIANRIRHSIFNLSVDGVSVTVSIGISTYRIDSFDKKNLIFIADQCLYEAKSIGKNQVVSK